MIAAVIVSYAPDAARLSAVLAAACSQCDAVWVVDNFADGNVDPAHFTTGDHAVHWLLQSDNRGIAYAQNIGIAAALDAGAEKIILLDHDSVLDAGAVHALYQGFSQANDIAAVGCWYRMGEKRIPSPFVRNGWFRFKRVSPQALRSTAYCEVDFMIASGTMVSRAALETVGEMDEGFFIDHVDTDWCLRARNCGYTLLGATAAGMSHSLGEHVRQLNIGRRRFIPYHKPFRYYYIFRNSLILYRRDYVSFQFISADMVRLASIMVLCIAVSSHRVEAFKMALRGIVDGLRGITGARSA